MSQSYSTDLANFFKETKEKTYLASKSFFSQNKYNMVFNEKIISARTELISLPNKAKSANVSFVLVFLSFPSTHARRQSLYVSYLIGFLPDLPLQYKVSSSFFCCLFCVCWWVCDIVVYFFVVCDINILFLIFGAIFTDCEDAECLRAFIMP